MRKGSKGMQHRKQIKVLHVVESLELGGAERVITDLIRSLPPTVVPSICCMKHSGEMASRLEQNVPIFELHTKMGNDIYLPFRLASLIRHHEIDLVHAHNWNTFLEAILASILAGVSIVHTIHGMYPPLSSGCTARIKRCTKMFFERVAAKKSSKICVVSQAIADYCIPHLQVPKQKVPVIINGVDTETPFEEPEQVRRKLGVTKDQLVLCFVGRLAPVKNLPLLLTAMPALLETDKNIQLLIIGDGPERAYLSRLTEDLGIQTHVHFVGFHANTTDFLHCSDIFVLPSRYEGISIALLEAMAAGLPVVATAVGGNGQCIIPQETGLLIPNDSREELIKAINALKDPQLREKMGKMGKKRVIHKFSLTKTAERYTSVYLQAVKNK